MPVPVPPSGGATGGGVVGGADGGDVATAAAVSAAAVQEQILDALVVTGLTGNETDQECPGRALFKTRSRPVFANT